MITIQIDLTRVAGKTDEQLIRMIDKKIETLGSEFGWDKSFKVVRTDMVGTYGLVPCDSPFGVYWPQNAVWLALRDGGLSTDHIERLFEE